MFARQKAKAGVVINLTDDLDAAKGINVPDGGTLFVVKTRVDPAWPWDPMLKETCPNYQSSDVQAVADLFPPQAGRPVDCYFYGLNFGKSVPDAQPAVDWVKKQDNLREAGPRHLYSVARDVPDLNMKVGVSYMGVIAPQFVTFGRRRCVCHASFDENKREARLGWFGHDWYDSAWFGSFRELPLV